MSTNKISSISSVQKKQKYKNENYEWKIKL